MVRFQIAVLVWFGLVRYDSGWSRFYQLFGLGFFGSQKNFEGPRNSYSTSGTHFDYGQFEIKTFPNYDPPYFTMQFVFFPRVSKMRNSRIQLHIMALHHRVLCEL